MLKPAHQIATGRMLQEDVSRGDAEEKVWETKHTPPSTYTTTLLPSVLSAAPCESLRIHPCQCGSHQAPDDIIPPARLVVATQPAVQAHQAPAVASARSKQRLPHGYAPRSV